MLNNRLDAERVQQIERRGFPRYPALDNTSQIGWRHDGRLVTSSAQLMDVSRAGMLVLVDDDPPHGVPVMIRLLSPTVTTWFEARVAESRAMRQGPYQLRLVFSNGLPMSFFALAASRYEDMN
ncbi:PilZ domain-containing protein [Singulisphaera acidiphila]|uniref:PilZ domain-containing protein n=1 Tax=Singulisphaera acidiphila (strain ATCC BAA-1392 / DSM 18658 / VKM B-2454 / MOB10) TaxID=886293 RepID=L0DAW9_SINAD|nr:PilZ domain-containing protein [Singulisphaera acidiphila]AGA25816.1 PilZ domain-containing protein [Singulisphaera acidiphila DSM 18658]